MWVLIKCCFCTLASINNLTVLLPIVFVHVYQQNTQCYHVCVRCWETYSKYLIQWRQWCEYHVSSFQIIFYITEACCFALWPTHTLNYVTLNWVYSQHRINSPDPWYRSDYSYASDFLPRSEVSVINVNVFFVLTLGAEHCGGGCRLLRWATMRWQHQGSCDPTGADGDDSLR